MLKSLAAVATAVVLAVSPAAASAATAAPAAPAVVAAPAAQAAYPDSVPTQAKATVAKKQKKRIKAGKRGKVKFSVVTVGNAVPRGTVRVIIKGKKGYTKRIKRSYDGGTITIKLPKLPKGDRYTVTTRFTAPATSVYKNSKSSFKVKVKVKK